MYTKFVLEIYFSTILLITLSIVFNSSFLYGEKLEFENIAFTIISQQSFIHENRALKLKNEIHKDTNFSSPVYLTHIDLKHFGDWTILPILPILWNKLKKKFTWLIFCTDETKVEPVRLKEVLEVLPSNTTFIGRGLQDDEPTIIHHFASINNFKYPLFSSGFALHKNLIKMIVENNSYYKNFQKVDFSIDASHELSLHIKQNCNGTFLTHSNFFCIAYKKNCATSIRNYICDKQAVEMEKIFFAVKTCHKFHKSRIPVIQKTWGQWAYHLKYFSDTFDKSIPTVNINFPNTERGHCIKTELIIKNIYQTMMMDKNLKWAVISDDDTIFSTYRLQELMGCYNSAVPIAIGERYGYNVLSNHGYNYITGGGGIILSREAVKKFAEGNCKCPSESTPDDMFLLGICLSQLNIKIVHIPLFHQARPNDYSKEYLEIGHPISFHKHWMIDPIKVYKDWFLLSDILSVQKKKHTEL